MDSKKIRKKKNCGLTSQQLKESVVCRMNNSELCFDTRLKAIDEMLKGALECEGEYECMYTNILFQLLMGKKYCSDDRHPFNI